MKTCLRPVAAVHNAKFAGQVTLLHSTEYNRLSAFANPLIHAFATAVLELFVADSGIAAIVQVLSTPHYTFLCCRLFRTLVAARPAGTAAVYHRILRLRLVKLSDRQDRYCPWQTLWKYFSIVLHIKMFYEYLPEWTYCTSMFAILRDRQSS